MEAIVDRRMMLDDLREVLTRIREHVAKVRAGRENWAIFGTGNTAELYQKAFSVERIRPICYVDNSISIGKKEKFHDMPAFAPSELVNFPDAVTLICTYHRKYLLEIMDQLDTMQVPYLLAPQYIFSEHIEEIMGNAAVLDDYSLAIYSDIIHAHLFAKPMHYFDRNEYYSIPNFSSCRGKEIFVDIGAYVGDTIESYLEERQGLFSKIYAIEPNAENFKAMQCRVERLKREWALNDERITLIHGAVGAKSSKARILEASGTAAHIGGHVEESNDMVEQNGEEVTIYSIDDLFADIHVGFLKADIESYEMDMLHGAMKVIKRDRPKLAICIYHNASDLYQILAYLRTKLEDYCFAVRHHAPLYLDTVLYAYPKEDAV